MARPNSQEAVRSQLDVVGMIVCLSKEPRDRYSWTTRIRIRDEAAKLFQIVPYYGALRSTLVVCRRWHIHAFTCEEDVRAERCARYEDNECSPVLSLLDVAIVSGDMPKASILHSIGVPQYCPLRFSDFCSPFTAVADSRTTRAVITAYKLCKPLFRELCEEPESLGKAIAGGQDSLSALFVLKGASDAAKKGTGNFLFRIWTLETRKHCQLALDMERLMHAVDLGIDIRSLLVDPWTALFHACGMHRFARFRRNILGYFRRLGHLRSPKWRAGQTLLEMAIRCGQLDATRYLANAHCEATGLTASDLTGPMFQETIDYDSVYDLEEHDTPMTVTINRDVGAAEAARLAYHLCRHRYQIVIVQMARWWSRGGGGVCVTFGRVVDHIAAFALAVPALPQILQLPRPLGTRRAAKRAAYRRRRAGQRAATTQQVVQSSEQGVKSSVQVNGCKEEVGPEVIQEVVHESQEVAAFISEDEAKATSQALWESAVGMTVARSVATGSDPEAGTASQHTAERIYLGKLNRIPKELLRALASGPALQPCRRALEAEGFPWKLSSGAFMFVSPCQHVDAMTALADEQLHPDNIIFAESLEYLIDEVLGQHGTWMKDRSAIGMDSIDPGIASEVDSGCHAEAESQGSDVDRRRDAFLVDYRSGWDPCSLVDRTFLCLAPVRSSLMVTASTTDAVNPDANPRRTGALEP